MKVEHQGKCTSDWLKHTRATYTDLYGGSGTQQGKTFSPPGALIYDPFVFLPRKPWPVRQRQVMVIESKGRLLVMDRRLGFFFSRVIEWLYNPSKIKAASRNQEAAGSKAHSKTFATSLLITMATASVSIQLFICDAFLPSFKLASN